MKTSFKAVPDTNVIIAAEHRPGATSPNREFIERWKNAEFEMLYSQDTLLEYIQKLREKRISEISIKQLIQAIFELGSEVLIQFYHLPYYPIDADDIAFLLCAENGQATHIISYDRHLKAIEPFYSFKVCGTREFLIELREVLLD